MAGVVHWLEHTRRTRGEGPPHTPVVVALRLQLHHTPRCRAVALRGPGQRVLLGVALGRMPGSRLLHLCRAAREVRENVKPIGPALLNTLSAGPLDRPPHLEQACVHALQQACLPYSLLLWLVRSPA